MANWGRQTVCKRTLGKYSYQEKKNLIKKIKYRECLPLRLEFQPEHKLQAFIEGKNGEKYYGAFVFLQREEENGDRNQ